MGIHNSSSPPIEQRVGNPITEKNQKNINMKAFTTACALVAGVSAASYFGGIIPVYTTGAPHPHPFPQFGGPYSRPMYGLYQPHPIAGLRPIYAPSNLHKREAEPSFTYQSKVTHTEERSVYEYRVNVDQLGNGKSYQFQQRDNMHQRQSQMRPQMVGPMDPMNNQRMQYDMDSRMGGRMNINEQMVRQGNNQMMNERGRDSFDRMIEQRQDDRVREYLRRQDGRMNNIYSYERMLQRQNEARRNMNNRDMTRQGMGRFDDNRNHRMFKREAESSFEYDVTAEHENNNNRQLMSRNQQMMDAMTRPQQQTYQSHNQMDSRMNSHMNQMNNQHMQYNMDNRMDGRMNQNEQMMKRLNNQMMNRFDNQKMNQFNRYSMDNQMDTRMNQMDTRMNQMGTRMNQMDSHRNHMDTRRNHMDTHRMDTQMNQMRSRNNQRMQYNQMTNQMHQRQFGDANTFGFDRATMKLQNNRFQQDQLRNYF